MVLILRKFCLGKIADPSVEFSIQSETAPARGVPFACHRLMGGIKSICNGNSEEISPSYKGGCFQVIRDRTAPTQFAFDPVPKLVGSIGLTVGHEG